MKSMKKTYYAIRRKHDGAFPAGVGGCDARIESATQYSVPEEGAIKGIAEADHTKSGDRWIPRNLGVNRYEWVRITATTRLSQSLKAFTMHLRLTVLQSLR